MAREPVRVEKTPACSVHPTRAFVVVQVKRCTGRTFRSALFLMQS
jgi:hypothetical protein